MNQKKIRIQDLTKVSDDKNPIVMITAYDYPSAKLVDAAGVDMILVGDSVGSVVLGMDNTLSVTLEQIIHHCKAVSKAKTAAFLVADLPFGSYQADKFSAVNNAIRLVKEGSCEAVKLEGGAEISETIKAIVDSGIPVMGHIGLRPQAEHLTGGYRVQGRSAVSAEKIINDAKQIESAGCFSVVLEAIPQKLGDIITGNLLIPTIGIGAGKNCDGQVLVYHDVIGMNTEKSPKFVKHYGNIKSETFTAVSNYCQEVRDKKFPDLENSYLMDKKELGLLRKSLTEHK